MIRFLSSTKLAVALCLVLAAEGIAGSLLYKGNTAFGGQGPFNLFRSPLFLVPAALLVVNILVCAGRRLAARTFRARRAATFAGIHLGLVLLAAGMIADGISGFVGTRNYYVGLPSSEYFNWRTSLQENFPFTVEVTGLSVRYHPLNLRIGVRDAAGNKVGLFTVREGASFRADGTGILITPRRFDAETKTLLFDAEVAGRPVEGVSAGVAGSPPVGGYVVVPVAFADPEPSDFVVSARFSVPGRAPEEKVIRVNQPATFAGISFCLVSEDRDRYRNAIVGLQMTREPGEPLFWAGGLLFGISLVLHLVLRGTRSGAQPDAETESAAAGDRTGQDPETAVGEQGPCARPGRTPAGIATVVALAAAGGLFAAGPAGAASGIVISADTAWEGEVAVAAPVTVEKGGTLRIRPGTRVLLSGEDADGDGCRDGYIQVFGRLIVEGEKGRPVRFLPLTPGLMWQEVFLKNAEGVIRYAEFSGALWGLHIHDSGVAVDHAVFRDNGGGTRLRGAGVSFTRCTFRDNGVALRFWDGGPTVEGSVIEGNGVGLFYREGAGGGRFRGNRIANREWNLKVGDWAAGSLDASGNWWGPGGGDEVPLVKDYREKKEGGMIRLFPVLREPPDGCGADDGREERR